MLRECFLSENQIESLLPLDSENQKYLEYLNVTSNAISSVEEIRHLSTFPCLSHLRLDGNPCVKVMECQPSKLEDTCIFDPESKSTMSSLIKRRAWVLHTIPQITCLDGTPISSEERAHAKNIFDPSVEFITALQHGYVIRQQIKQYFKLSLKPFMSMDMYHPIIICGQKGVGKRCV